MFPCWFDILFWWFRRYLACCTEGLVIWEYNSQTFNWIPWLLVSENMSYLRVIQPNSSELNIDKISTVVQPFWKLNSLRMIINSKLLGGWSCLKPHPGNPILDTGDATCVSGKIPGKKMGLTKCLSKYYHNNCL